MKRMLYLLTGVSMADCVNYVADGTPVIGTLQRVVAEGDCVYTADGEPVRAVLKRIGIDRRDFDEAFPVDLSATVETTAFGCEVEGLPDADAVRVWISFSPKYELGVVTRVSFECEMRYPTGFYEPDDGDDYDPDRVAMQRDNFLRSIIEAGGAENLA